MNKRKIFLNTDFDVRYEISEQGCNIPLLTYHDLYEIYILETGRRTTVINDKIFDTAPNDAAMFTSLVLHQSYGDTPYSGICFHFSDTFLDAHFSKTAKEQILKCFDTPMISLDDDSMLKIKDLAHMVEENSTRRFVYLCELLEILYKNSLNMHPDNSKQLNAAKICSSEKMSEIMDYINRKFPEIKNIGELCGKFDISEGYLCRAFKKQTGMTIVQYINTLKINYACRFLSDRYSNKNITYIANECGFESSSYFIRVFKKMIGTTPMNYRISLATNYLDENIQSKLQK